MGFRKTDKTSGQKHTREIGFRFGCLCLNLRFCTKVCKSYCSLCSENTCTAHRPSASPFVSMPRGLAPSPERVPLTHERTILPASPCAWPRAVSAQRTRMYPELQRGGGQRLFVLAVEVGGRRNADSQALVRQLVRVRALRVLSALRAAASNAWTRRWWGMLSTAVQHAVGGTALGAPWLSVAGLQRRACLGPRVGAR